MVGIHTREGCTVKIPGALPGLTISVKMRCMQMNTYRGLSHPKCAQHGVFSLRRVINHQVTSIASRMVYPRSTPVQRTVTRLPYQTQLVAKQHSSPTAPLHPHIKYHILSMASLSDPDAQNVPKPGKCASAFIMREAKLRSAYPRFFIAKILDFHL